MLRVLIDTFKMLIMLIISHRLVVIFLFNIQCPLILLTIVVQFHPSNVQSDAENL